MWVCDVWVCDVWVCEHIRRAGGLSAERRSVEIRQRRFPVDPRKRMADVPAEADRATA